MYLQTASTLYKKRVKKKKLKVCTNEQHPSREALLCKIIDIYKRILK